MLEFLMKIYIFMLILTIFSYLVPKDEYKKYIQFFIGIFVVVLLLKPILEIVNMNNPTRIYEVFDSFNVKMQEFNVEFEKGETIYEYFFLEGEGK